MLQLKYDIEKYNDSYTVLCENIKNKYTQKRKPPVLCHLTM